MEKIYPIITLFCAFLLGCGGELSVDSEIDSSFAGTYITVLGVAQDAGFPQAGCQKSCCRDLWGQPAARKTVTSLGIVDKVAGKTWLLEATPDFKQQIFRLASELQGQDQASTEIPLPDGILLTHAHMGHYTGLIHLGREAMGTKRVKVYAMPRMKKFLETNGPWSQLVSLENVALQALREDSTIQLSKNIKITPFTVPHRDEFSETVGYRIEGLGQSVLFIPDIDKWGKWEKKILAEVAKVDFAFLDGTFYKNGEIKGRDMSLIPHPFIEETTAIFENAAAEERKKVCFIHFNHTNPVMNENSPEYRALSGLGFSIAREGMRISLD